MSGKSIEKNTIMENIRSPFDNIFSMINGLPQGHEKPLKHALYNALALLLLFLCCAVVWALYLILQPFIKPLVWALLVGSVLHPLKYNLTKNIRTWFEQLKLSKKPVVIGLVMLPLNIVNDSSEFIGSKLLKHIKLIIAVSLAIPFIHILYNYTPGFCITFSWQLCSLACSVISLLLTFNSTSVMIVFLLCYIGALFVYWKPETANKFHYAAHGSWLLVSCYVAQFAGDYNIHAFVFLQIVYLAGFIIEVIEIHEDSQTSVIKSVIMALTDTVQLENEEKKDVGDTFIESIGDNTTETLKKTKEESENPFALELFQKENASIESLINETATKTSISDSETASTIPHKRPCCVPTSTNRRHTINNSSMPRYRRNFIESQILSRVRPSKVQPEDTGSITSDFYFYGVLWACGIMLFWKHAFLLTILPIPMLIYIFKHVGTYLGLWSCMSTKIKNISTNIKSWCTPRLDAIVPLHIRGICKIVSKGNMGLESCLTGGIDTVASIVVILGLIIFLTCASIFICIQVYAEAITLVQLGSNVINSTVVHNPELRQLLPPGWDDTVDSLLDNAYTYGRDGISKAMRGLMRDVEDAKAAKLEQQVLELWDRVYQTWVSSDSNNIIGPQVTQHAVQHSWSAFLEDIQTSPEMFNFNGLVEFLKQNVGMFISLMESVWSILKGNISLVLGSCSAFLSILLGGGTAVLNFILNVIVFLTTLFYLLSSSGILYKPVEILSSMSPSNGSRFGLALEQAINGVFKATGKMAVFYGLWTWFIHNLFGVKIVYLPSALATILGAVPFLGPYWACLPAVLDLWLAQDHVVLACLIALCQFAPCAFIDATIYQEIKGGGHPYLTGLAIAGGIFWLGVEGAIVGPLLLCGLFVAMDLSSTLFRETPSEDINLPIRLQRMETME